MFCILFLANAVPMCTYVAEEGKKIAKRHTCVQSPLLETFFKRFYVAVWRKFHFEIAVREEQCVLRHFDYFCLH